MTLTTSVRPDPGFNPGEGRPASPTGTGLRQAQPERNKSLSRANLLALILPAALLAGAWASQLIGGLVPCEMCHWQRWPHYAALPVAALAFFTTGRTRAGLVVLAALLIAGSGVIAVLHAGVEYHWWRGFTPCTSATPLAGATGAERLDALLRQPIIRCDTAQWSLFGVSLAGFNALFSIGGALAILGLVRRAR